MPDRISIPSKELALAIVGPSNSLLLPRVQRVGLDLTANSQDVDELGNPNHTGTTLDIPEATLTFSAFDVGIKIFSILTGTDYTAYPAVGVDITSLGEIDAILYVKSATANDRVKAAHAKRLQIRDFTYTYNVDGDSTEEYSAIGSEKRVFKNTVTVDRITTGTTSFNLTQTPVQLKNGNKLLSVILDGVYLTEVAATPGTTEYSVSGTTVTTGASRSDQFIAVYQSADTTGTWLSTADTQMPASVKGKDVKVVIGANDISRVQSITINGNLRPEPVKEMGSRTTIGYQRQNPTVEGSITVLDTDTELIGLLVTGDINTADTEFTSVESACTLSGVSLEVKLIDPCDTTAPYTVLKTVYIPSITIVGDSYASNVNGNATQTFNFKSATGSLVVYSGARS